MSDRFNIGVNLGFHSGSRITPGGSKGGGRAIPRGYLDKLVYSDVSATTLTVAGVVIYVPSTSGSKENKP